MLRNPVMTKRNTKHDLPSIGNGSRVEGQIGRQPEEEKEGQKMEIIESRLWGKKINLIIDTSVERRERERERDQSHFI